MTRLRLWLRDWRYFASLVGCENYDGSRVSIRLRTEAVSRRSGDRNQRNDEPSSERLDSESCQPGANGGRL